MPQPHTKHIFYNLAVILPIKHLWLQRRGIDLFHFYGWRYLFLFAFSLLHPSLGEGGRGGEKKKLQQRCSQEVMTHSLLMEGTRMGGEAGTSSWALPACVTAFISMTERGTCVAGRKGNCIKLRREGSYQSCVPIGCFVS